jgi:hypothetical protein
LYCFQLLLLLLLKKVTVKKLLLLDASCPVLLPTLLQANEPTVVRSPHIHLHPLVQEAEDVRGGQTQSKQAQ